MQTQTVEPVTLEHQPPRDPNMQVVPHQGGALTLLDRLLQGTSPDQIEERLEKLILVLDRLRIASIKATYPTDWLIHTTTDKDGNVLRQVAYLQDCGADRAGKIWGIEVDEPSVEQIPTPEEGEGTYMVKMTADGWSNVTGERALGAIGSRWSGDTFFQKGLRDGEKPNPSNVHKAAYANLHGNIVRRLAGLKQVSLKALAEAGLDVKGCLYISYSKGAKGGESTGASAGSADFKFAFGNCKGKTLAETSEADLEWYRKAFERDLGNPDKAQYKNSNERNLKAVTAELERRKQAKEQKAETGTAPRNERLTTQYRRVEAASKEQNIAIKEAVKRVLSDVGSTATKFSEVTDEQLEKIEALEDDVLSIVIAGFQD